ncbi:hypothetical protein E3P99_03192 [Wallemia hederae]|uniref:Uncharacterized protein n=1 Tax=Wallemia hederae TaxID=1540922 RepID=A0A4T0FGH0_9BASI|nr:hypothetical protein E3P99_03192 [Wallemia hederae]
MTRGGESAPNATASTSTEKKKGSSGLSATTVAGITVLAFAAVSISTGATIWRANRARSKARQAVVDFRSNYHIEKRPAPLPVQRLESVGVDGAQEKEMNMEMAAEKVHHQHFHDPDAQHFTYGDAGKALLIATAGVSAVFGGAGWYAINKMELSDIQDTKTKLNAFVRTRFKTLYDSIHKFDGTEEDIPDDADARELARQWYGEEDEEGKRAV